MNVKLSDQQKVKILNSDDVFEIMQKILHREDKIDQDKEHFWIIGLANNNKALFIELVSIGSVKATVVEPMNVFRVAILKNAVKVILVHNHPSGELKPSDEDKDVTDRLIQVGRIINVEVIDHLIITLKSFLSFEDIGLFEELKKSMKWMPQYEVIENIRKEEKKLRNEAVQLAEEKGELRGIKKGKIEIAKALKQKGVDITIIAETSGLSKKEIKKL